MIGNPDKDLTWLRQAPHRQDLSAPQGWDSNISKHTKTRTYTPSPHGRYTLGSYTISDIPYNSGRTLTSLRFSQWSVRLYWRLWQLLPKHQVSRVTVSLRVSPTGAPSIGLDWRCPIFVDLVLLLSYLQAVQHNKSWEHPCFAIRGSSDTRGSCHVTCRTISQSYRLGPRHIVKKSFVYVFLCSWLSL